MNTFLKFSFVLLFVSISYANNTITSLIKLPKHFKVDHTFSGDLSNTTSFHLIFSKNKKNKLHTIHPYIFDGNDITTLEAITNEFAYNIVSFHKEDTVLSLLLSFTKDKKEFIKRIDIDLSSNSIKENEAINHEDFSTSIRKKNSSILVYKNKKEFKLIAFKGTDKVKTLTYTYDKNFDKYRDFFDSHIEAVKTDEFVANGSVAKLRAYLDDSKLIFTKENTIHGYTEYLSIPLNKEELIPSNITSFKNRNSEGAYKKITSFYHNNKLYQFANNKKTGSIKIHSLDNGNSSTINIDQSLLKSLVKTNHFNGFEAFLKAAGKNKHNTTITVNKTKDDNVKVRVDYVDIEYSYHYNWWWHHHMMHMNMMHQQIQFSAPAGFGPTQPNDIHFNNYEAVKEKKYFEFVIDNENKLVNNTLSETTYKEVDKKHFIDKLEEISDFKHESSCFLKASFRFIVYSRNLKGFIIQTNNI
ncbi:conserved protein of unknown function [Tenacibaculum sp. 190130A14a]|uniref:Uncharacterized protein n=1 Tax=Tenacibaculum polynesiense TaxID=3137857 RepID=A0ABP1F274_9FLAO